MSTTVDLGKITASVTVGTTTTGAAGTNASVSNSGTTQDAVLNFTIPRGAQGVQGPQGIQGNTGPAGPTGPQGPMGDVAVITPEQQAAFTMYSVPGQNTDGPMTQKAVTDALVASAISYDNSQSGLASDNVQVALDELGSFKEMVEESMGGVDAVEPSSIVTGYLKSDGTINEVSGNARVGVFTNIDDSKTYYASGRVQTNSQYASVCYYNSSDVKIGTEASLAPSSSAYNYQNHKLNVPSGTSIIRIQGHTTEQYPELYKGEGMVDVKQLVIDMQGIEDRTSANEDDIDKLGELLLVNVQPDKIYENSALKANNSLFSASSAAYVKRYKNIDATKKYFISGYVVSSSNFAMCVFYDDDGVVKGTLHIGNGSTGTAAVDEPITIPSGTTRIRISGNRNYQAADLKIYVENPQFGNYWSGKKCVWNGDSISYGSGLENNLAAYPYKVCESLGMSIVNYAIGGTIVAKGGTSYVETQGGKNYDEVFMSMAEFEAATKDTSKSYLVRDGNTGEQRPYGIYHYSGGSWVKWGTNSVTCGRTPLVDRITEMDTDADLVVIACGTNDFYYCWSNFGTMADGIANPDKTTFYGALHLVCRYLIDTYVGKDIVIVNIIKRVQNSPWHCYEPLDKNYFDLNIEDYNKAIKEVCDYYSIPVVDLYSNSLLNPSFDTSMFVDQSTSSGLYFTHPNDKGHIRMAKLVKAFLMQYISDL